MPEKKKTRRKRTPKTEILECMRRPRVCRHCGAVETLKTYRSIPNGVLRVAWARCSECHRVTKEKTVMA